MQGDQDFLTNESSEKFEMSSSDSSQNKTAYDCPQRTSSFTSDSSILSLNALKNNGDFIDEPNENSNMEDDENLIGNPKRKRDI